MKRVVLVTSKDDGSVVDVLDASTKRSLPYEIVEERAAQECAPTQVVADSLPGVKWAPAELACWRAFSDQVAAFVPLPGCEVERQLPGCTAYVMAGNDVPCAGSPFPLDMRYATGVSLVEIESVTASGLSLTESFFRSEEFQAAVSEARRALRGGGRGHPPGVIGRKMHASFSAYTSPGYEEDPLLRKYTPLPFDAWEPHLRQGDFLGIYKSVWEKVNRQVAAMAGHVDGQTHFYAVVGWHLPVEIADQLAHVVKCNPEGMPWSKMIARKEFQHAEELSLTVRERLLDRFLQLTKLSIKARGGEVSRRCARALARAHLLTPARSPQAGSTKVVHCTSDVFRPVTAVPERVAAARAEEDDGDDDTPRHAPRRFNVQKGWPAIATAHDRGRAGSTLDSTPGACQRTTARGASSACQTTTRQNPWSGFTGRARRAWWEAPRGRKPAARAGSPSEGVNSRATSGS